VIDDTSSNDGTNLVARMDEAIRTGCIEDLKPLWEYVKSRQSRLRTELTEPERSALDSFILEKRKEKCFILSKGALESYLPVGFKSKDLEKVIRLVEEPGLWDRLPSEVKGELQEIIASIAF
jgi:hypothetical protein